MQSTLKWLLLCCTLVALPVAWQGIRSSRQTSTTNELMTPGYGVVEVEQAVKQIEVGVSTRKDIDVLIRPYVESRSLYRLKDTGADRNYFFVPRDRQIWMEFSTGADAVETVTKMGELEPRAKWIRSWEGGYITFSPSESPW